MNTYNSGGESATKKQGGGKRKSSTLAQATAPKPKTTTAKKAKTPTVPPEVMVQSIIALAQDVGGHVGVNHAQKLVILLPEWTVVEGKATKL